MKHLILPAILLTSLMACKSPRKEELALQDSLLNFHEKVMGDDEKAVMNKMKLDSLILKADSLKADKKQAIKISDDIAKADAAMSDWMAKLDTANFHKEHTAVIAYLTQQQQKVTLIDSMLIKATNEANAYLKNPQIK